MFNKGDKIIYGQTGVCIVEDICEKTLMRNVTKQYYTLKPIYQSNNIIYAPVDNEKVFMRYVITKDEAESLINQIPDIRNKTSEDISQKTDEANGKSDFERYECCDLIGLAIKMHDKKQNARRLKKKMGYMDEKNMKKVEELLFGELAVALEMAVEDVPNLIFSCFSK